MIRSSRCWTSPFSIEKADGFEHSVKAIGVALCERQKLIPKLHIAALKERRHGQKQFARKRRLIRRKKRAIARARFKEVQHLAADLSEMQSAPFSEPVQRFPIGAEIVPGLVCLRARVERVQHRHEIQPALLIRNRVLDQIQQ